MIRRRSSSQSTGFTLIELLLVLGVVALIAVASFSVYRNVVESNRQKTMIETWGRVWAGLDALYPAGRTGSGTWIPLRDITNTSTAGISRFSSARNWLEGPWGERVSANWVNRTASCTSTCRDVRFQISQPAGPFISAQGCVKLLTHVWDSAYAISGTNGWAKVGDRDFDMALVNRACQGEQRTLTIYMSLDRDPS